MVIRESVERVCVVALNIMHERSTHKRAYEQLSSLPYLLLVHCRQVIFGDNIDKRSDQVRIELFAGTPLDLIECRRNAQGLSVSPVCNNGVKRICYADDPCPERDLLSLEVHGVPFAVPSFVVMKDPAETGLGKDGF